MSSVQTHPVGENIAKLGAAVIHDLQWLAILFRSLDYQL